MNKQQVRDRITEIGIVPVVRASSAAEALLAAEAVCDGGISIVEITMTVPDAVEVIRELRKSGISGVLIGAGTGLDVETAGSRPAGRSPGLSWSRTGSGPGGPGRSLASGSP